MAIMAVETLRPNAAGDLTQLEQEPGTGSNYDKVDDVSPDNNTYVRQAFEEENGSGTDLYHLPNSAIGAGIIENVKVTIRAGIFAPE